MEEKKKILKMLPKVDTILADLRIERLHDISRVIIVDSIREVLETERKDILADKIRNIDFDTIVEKIIKTINKKNSMKLTRVINATGTVLHTNLGRAVMPKVAVEEVIKIASRYNNLEYDIDKGSRGSRYSHVEALISKITGAEAALVVNNNAGAILLALSALAKDKEAIVSRGQMVEIGGSFRIPAVMELSGAKLVEVGTTNRTHLYDYENAINENTGVILKVHQSNYKIVGFTEEVEIEELTELGKKHSIPVVEDIGSGVFLDLSNYGLSYEPTVQNSIKKGIDVVTFSGDKLLGGPQAGIIVGKKEYIDKMKKNQLTRALRIDKMTLVALEAILRLYLDEHKAIAEIPVLNMLTRDINAIKADAERLSKSLKSELKEYADIRVIKDFSQVGGGSMPIERLETYAISIVPKAKAGTPETRKEIGNVTAASLSTEITSASVSAPTSTVSTSIIASRAMTEAACMSVEELEHGLRTSEIPIITRIFKDSIIIDVRTLFAEEYKIIKETLVRLLRS
jgi:L-seryl-tRNA(Ser) seleniumtransferase